MQLKEMLRSDQVTKHFPQLKAIKLRLSIMFTLLSLLFLCYNLPRSCKPNAISSGSKVFLGVL